MTVLKTQVYYVKGNAFIPLAVCDLSFSLSTATFPEPSQSDFERSFLQQHESLLAQVPLKSPHFRYGLYFKILSRHHV